MAQPDFGLLDTTLPYKVGSSALKGMGDVNALAAQNLQNRAAEFEIQNALAEQEAYKQAAQTGGVQQALMERGLGKQAAAYGKTTAETQKLGLEAQMKKVELQYARNSQLAADPSDQNVIRSLEQQVRSGEVSPDQAMKAWGQVQGMNPQQRTEYFTKMSMSAEKLLGTQLRQQEADVSRRRLEFEMNPTQQAGIAQAKAAGQETGKSGAQAAANLPAAVQTANEAIALIDEMVGKAPVIKDGKVVEKGTAPHPGFSSYVGATLTPGARFIEGTDAASYELRQKQIEGQAFLEAFRSLKGGGSITEKEGEKATAAITRMNKSASEKEYITAARELQGILREGVKRAQAKAARGTIGGGGPLPKNRWADALAEFEAQENQ